MREWCECVDIGFATLNKPGWRRRYMPDCCPHCGRLLATLRDNHVPRCHRSVLSDTRKERADDARMD